jgi:hypothetical protein
MINIIAGILTALIVGFVIIPIFCIMILLAKIAWKILEFILFEPLGRWMDWWTKILKL